ncbi:nuclear transport factor 2 family protein [Flavihumibacter rivuli]|uniref:YybH family protein n=1 Tax=Flavihumibacter rivuli TaxID=2838156 RepID=UPI001BDF71B9|nr:nuclear transport factor 2 family protein [Flavihumibacter rivuli]ULQ56069.1 nuclear transport factor 2 family protein [Flavihumibacter rivuli]
MRAIVFSLLFMAGFAVNAQDPAVSAITDLMARQQADWNRGDITAFMEGYWKSDSLMFIGSNGVTYGFQNTFDRYKKRYDSREKMGTLTFSLLHINRISDDVYMVVGKWFLKRTVGDVGGHFTLIFRRINGRWVITSDHTS